MKFDFSILGLFDVQLVIQRTISFWGGLNPWVVFGLFGQFFFFMRFFVQWLESEQKKKSVIPISFWYYSIVGTAILAVYAIHRNDPVFILGQSLGLFVYIRNLVLIYREQSSEQFDTQPS